MALLTVCCKGGTTIQDHLIAKLSIEQCQFNDCLTSAAFANQIEIVLKLIGSGKATLEGLKRFANNQTTKAPRARPAISEYRAVHKLRFNSSNRRFFC